MAKRASSRIEFVSDGVFKHRSEVLWSRASDDLFTDEDYGFRNICRSSDSEGTHSSSSWGFANYEKKSVEKITSYLSAIDTALYEDDLSSLNPELITECQKWKQAFPHLRLKGKQIVPEADIFEDLDQHLTKGSLPSEKSIACKRIVYGSSPFETSRCALPKTDAGSYLFNEDQELVEEVIAKDDVQDDFNESLQCIQSTPMHSQENWSDRKPAFSTYYIKEKIIEQLADVVWKNVISACTNNISKDDPRKSERLPPISVSRESIDLPPLQQFKVKGTLASDFPKLDGILMVSPKVLLPKSGRPFSRAELRSRPSTGWSSASRTTSASSQSSSSKKNSGKFAENKHNSVLDCADTKVTEKDLELIRMYLPTVEEDSPVLNGLQGLHIEPEVKRLTRLTSFDAISPVAKPPCFLPPIDDRDVITLRNKNSKNALYEPHKRRDGNQNNCIIYARHLNRTGSRPSTSQTEDVVSDLGRMKRPESNMSSKHKDCTVKQPTSSSHGLVNLLPVVTSLEPKQLAKRKMTAQKRGVLSAICKEKR